MIGFHPPGLAASIPSASELGIHMESQYRLFIDQCGHHMMKSSADPSERYLGLTGIIMNLPYADHQFTEQLNAVKQATFGRSDFSLHRREIIDANTDPFIVLRDARVRLKFEKSLIDLIENATYKVVTAVIDKWEIQTKYAVWHFQPYHYCLTALLERYAMFLGASKATGDVMAWSMEEQENTRLDKHYRYLHEHGTANLQPQTLQHLLSPKEVKIKSDVDNIAGLQLADLISNPSCWSLICSRTISKMTSEFSKNVVEILYRKKYRKSRSGIVYGWGTKWLP